MKPFKAIILAFAVNSVIVTLNASTELKIGSKFESPNKKYIAEISEEGIIILDKIYQKNQWSILTFTPILDLRWLPTSEGMVVKQHIAHGSFLALFMFQENSWKMFEIAPLEKSVVYSVISYSIQEPVCEVWYKVTERAPNGAYGKSYRDRIIYDLHKMKMLSIEKMK
jgi:hypothetical protein